MSIGARRAGLVMLVLAVVAGVVVGQEELRKKGKKAELLPYKSGVRFVVTIERTNKSKYTKVTNATCKFTPAGGGPPVDWPLVPGKIKQHSNDKSVTLVFLPPVRLAPLGTGKPLPVPGKGLPSGQEGQYRTLMEYSTTVDEPGTVVITVDDETTPDDPTDPIPVDPIDFDPCAP